MMKLQLTENDEAVPGQDGLYHDRNPSKDQS
jgi:hypothetical protein